LIGRFEVHITQNLNNYPLIQLENSKHCIFPIFRLTLSDIYAKSSSSTKDDSNRRQKSRSITFIPDSSVIDEMQREADQNETSLDVLVKQVLKRYTDWIGMKVKSA
jgi:hypothetical protein